MGTLLLVVFCTLDIGSLSAPYIGYCTLRKCQYTASWAKPLPLPIFFIGSLQAQRDNNSSLRLRWGFIRGRTMRWWVLLCVASCLGTFKSIPQPARDRVIAQAFLSRKPAHLCSSMERSQRKQMVIIFTLDLYEF